MAKRKPLPTVEELRTMSWKEYMKTTHWRKFRKTLDTDDVVCEICGKKRWEFYKVGVKKGKRKSKPTCQFQTHHKHYDNLGREKREDVLYLCKTCHGLCHDLEMASRTRGGVYTLLYEIILNDTPWEYVPFKNRKV